MAVNPEYRPDPDTLLAHVQGEERQKHRGKLKIFLGYIAGVGKTYEMLQAAHLRKNEGIDVKIGYVETHGRAETEALVEGLPVIPRKDDRVPECNDPGNGSRCGPCRPSPAGACR